MQGQPYGYAPPPPQNKGTATWLVVLLSVGIPLYQSAAGDWEVDARRPRAGFACLKFSLDMPQYYMYSYEAHGVRTAGDGFRATANGDLDGDGAMSPFWIAGKVGPGGALSIEPQIGERDPEE